MHPTRTIALLSLGLLACDFPAVVGSNEIGEPGESEPEVCADDCEGHGAILWSRALPVREAAVRSMANGDIVVVGAPPPEGEGGPYPSDTMTMIVLDASGEWLAGYDVAIRRGWDIDIAETSDGHVAVAVGWNASYFAKLSLDGEVLWQYDLGDPLLDAAAAVAAGPDGSTFAAGSHGEQHGNPGPAAAGRPWLGKFEADGTLAWSRDTPPSAAIGSGGQVVDVAVDTDGDLLATGNGPWVGKFEADTGAELWSATYADLDGASEGITADGAGGFVVASFWSLLAARPSEAPMWNVETDDVTAVQELTRVDSGIGGAVRFDVENKPSNHSLIYQAFDVATGETLWSQPIEATSGKVPGHSIDVADGRMLAVMSEDTATLMALTL